MDLMRTTPHQKLDGVSEADSWKRATKKNYDRLEAVMDEIREIRARIVDLERLGKQ
jgi:hypothetical protein